jgi:hypothetical protein
MSTRYRPDRREESGVPPSSRQGASSALPGAPGRTLLVRRDGALGWASPARTFSGGAFSPSIWAGRRGLHDLPGAAAAWLWLDVGTAEWSPVALLADLFAENGFTYGRDLFYYEDPGAEHNERFWGARLASPLILFKGREPMEPVSLDAVVERLPAGRGAQAQTRINAVATLANGMRCTLLRNATYTPADPTACRVSPAGDVEFLKPGPCAVTVRTGSLERRVTLEAPARAAEPAREGNRKAS